jgi:hypothetical protein
VEVKAMLAAESNFGEPYIRPSRTETRIWPLPGNFRGDQKPFQAADSALIVT